MQGRITLTLEAPPALAVFCALRARSHQLALLAALCVLVGHLGVPQDCKPPLARGSVQRVVLG